jgi:hypothetical protein
MLYLRFLVSEIGRPVCKVNGITRWQTVISAVNVACKHMILDAFHPALCYSVRTNN